MDNVNDTLQQWGAVSSSLFKKWRCKWHWRPICSLPATPPPPSQSPSPSTPPPPLFPPPPYSVAMFEQATVTGWQGLALAVEGQPAIAFIAASWPSFMAYTAVSCPAVKAVG